MQKRCWAAATLDEWRVAPGLTIADDGYSAQLAWLWRLQLASCVCVGAQLSSLRMRQPFANLVKFLAPRRLLVWMRMLEITFDHTDEFGRSAVSLEIRRDQLQVRHFRTNFNVRYNNNVRML